MNVHNLMEDIVMGCFKDLMNKDTRLGNCDEMTQSDIVALTLNRLPAKYVSRLKGEVISKTHLRTQTESDVYRELSRAIDIVLEHPREQ